MTATTTATATATAARRRRRDLRGDDSGSVLLLVLGFTVVLGLLLVVVVDVSMVLLAQRGVASVADSAAVAAAQQLNEKAFYERGLAGGAVPLDPDAVSALVQGYGDRARPPVQLTGVVVDGGFTVEVRGARAVPLPFGSLIDQPTVTVRAVARATSPLAP